MFCWLLCMQIHHPFLLRLEATFRDDEKLYMVTELIQGGELFSVLSRHNRVRPPVAQFYGACVVSALEHLHLGTTRLRTSRKLQSPTPHPLFQS